jgi:hypothetical protein
MLTWLAISYLVCVAVFLEFVARAPEIDWMD